MNSEVYKPKCGHNLWTFTLACSECKRAHESLSTLFESPELQQKIKELTPKKVNPSGYIKTLLKIPKKYGR